MSHDCMTAPLVAVGPTSKIPPRTVMLWRGGDPPGVGLIPIADVLHSYAEQLSSRISPPARLYPYCSRVVRPLTIIARVARIWKPLPSPACPRAVPTAEQFAKE